jgi:hypothetical protein
MFQVVVAAVATAAPAGRYDVVMSVTPTAQGRPGSTVSAVLSWRNAGTAEAPTLRITYTPPLGTDIPASGLPAGWTKAGRSAVRITGAVLPPGASRSASIRVRIPAQAVPGTLLVGGEATARGLTGKDRAPADNTAYSRVQVLAAAPSPSPSPSTRRTPTPTPTPRPTPKPTPTPPAAKPTTQPTTKPLTVATGAPASRPAAAVRVPEPSLTASTYLVAAPRPTGSVQPSIVPGVIEVTDGPSVQLVPLVGALTCFTAAAIGGVAFRRRRAAAQAEVDEVRLLRAIH